MANAQALAFYDILAGSGDIEQKIDKVILKQVHLIYVKKAAMGAGEQPRLEMFFASAQRALNIERPNHAILSCPQRQVHNGGWLHLGLGLATRGRLAAGAEAGISLRCTIIWTAGDQAFLWQKGRQSPDSG